MQKTLTKSVNWDTENTIFFAYFVLTALIVYFIPNVWLIRLAFLPFLIIAYQTKKDYFWLAWFFIINDEPGGLFGGVSGSGDTMQRIPMYPLSLSGVSITFQELFYLTILVKALLANRNSSFAFKNQFKLFWSLSLILIIYTFSQRIGLDVIARIVRLLLPWSMVFSVSQLMNTENAYYRFCKLVFPIAILALITQIMVYLTGHDFLDFVGGQKNDLIGFSNISEDDFSMTRTSTSGMTVFFITITSLYYIVKNKNEFSVFYLILLLFITTLLTFLSGTRGWILAYGSIFILSTIAFPKNVLLKRIGTTFILGGILFYALVFAFPVIGLQAKSALSRFETVGLIVQGDVTAGGTLGRIDIRAPLVWAQAKESIILGYGFSDTYFGYSDIHVGPVNIILNCGFLGAIILNFIFFWLIYSIWQISKTRLFFSEQRLSVKIFAIGLVAIYIVHSSSGQLWGYQTMNGGYFLYVFILGFVSAIINTENLKKKIVPFNSANLSSSRHCL